MVDFTKKLDEALEKVSTMNIPGMSFSVHRKMVREAKAKLLKEQRRVLEGTYYWVPIMIKDGIRWEVQSFPDEVFKDTLHLEVWDKYVAPQLAKDFGKEDRLEDLREHPLGLPRGRMAKSIVRGFTVNTLAHGNDTPPGYNLQKVMGEFNFVPGQLNKVEFWDHEAMSKEDHRVVQEILGVDLGLMDGSEQGKT